MSGRRAVAPVAVAGVGLRGPGETKIETDRPHPRADGKLRRDIRAMSRSATQRGVAGTVTCRRRDCRLPARVACSTR